MPRFIARLRETRVFRRYIQLPMSTHTHDQFVEFCANYPKPNPFPSDWCITEVGSVHQFRLPPSIVRARTAADEDEWAMAISCPVTAEVSVIVYAKTERAAREHVLKEMNSYDGHRFHSGDSNRWNAYHYGNDVELLSLRQDKTGKALRHSFEVSVDQLVSPDRSWHPLHVDQVMETFRWLAISGKDYHKQCTWHDQTQSHLLSGGYGNNPFSWHELKPILSMKDLQKRFQFSLLATGYDFYRQWREDVGYQLGKTLKIDVPHRGKGYDQVSTGPIHTMSSALDEMLGESRKMRLAWSLNSSHPGAIEVQTIGLAVYESGFSFILRYGYPSDGSSWNYVLASTRGNEPFAETLNRAYVQFHKLIPDFKAQLQEQRERRWKREREERENPTLEAERA